MFTVKEVSEISKTTIKTLYHYDKIDLLKPSKVTSSGYRLYSEEDINRLGDILFFKNMGVPLKDIKIIINSSKDIRDNILKEYKSMLQDKVQNINNTIGILDMILQEEKSMFSEEGFKILQEYKKYESDIYKNYCEKIIEYSPKDWECIINFELDMYNKIYQLKSDGYEYNDGLIISLIKIHHEYINEKFSYCEKSVYMKLAMMHLNEERLVNYLDSLDSSLKAFITKSVEFYCLN